MIFCSNFFSSCPNRVVQPNSTCMASCTSNRWVEMGCNVNYVTMAETVVTEKGRLRKPIDRYLSRLWSDFENSFVWWKLVKIVTDFYSIGDFLSFTVWPLDVAEVTKVSRVNVFKQKIKFRNFWATSMLYTSKERIFHIEFKFKQKK